jgi:hypothetical protein
MRRQWIAAAMITLAAGFAGSAVAHAVNDQVTATATVNGQDVGSATASAPLRLDPGTPANVAVNVTNNGSQPVVIKRVELAGNVLGLSFFKYVASTELTVQPGTTGTLSYPLDLADLDTQATGLIRGDVTVADGAGQAIATVPTVTDVRGSLWSVSGLFGLSLIVFTALALFGVARAVARHRLPENRWKRGLRFLLPGIGIGLVLGFTAAVFRLWAPTTSVWVAAAGICAAVFFAIGYFLPTGGDMDDDQADDELADEVGYDDQATVDLGYDRDTEDFGYGQGTEDFGYGQGTEDLAAEKEQDTHDKDRDVLTIGNATRVPHHRAPDETLP